MTAEIGNKLTDYQAKFHLSTENKQSSWITFVPVFQQHTLRAKDKKNTNRKGLENFICLTRDKKKTNQIFARDI